MTGRGPRGLPPRTGLVVGSAALALLALVVTGCARRAPDGVLARGSIATDSGAVPTVSGFVTVPATRVQLWYERAGDATAPAVVLINGNDSQAIYWPDAFVGALHLAGYQVVRFDGRDTGLSQWLPFPDGFDPEAWTPEQPPPYPLSAHAADLLGLLDGLDISRAHLVGVSQGGMVAQIVALEAPGRVLSLALLSSTPSSPYDPALGGVEPELLAYLREQAPRVGRAAATSFLGGGRVVAYQTELLAAIAGIRDEPSPAREELRAYVQATFDRAGINARSSQGFAVAAARSRIEALGAVHVPTLVIHGRRDPFFRPRHAEALAEVIPGSRLVWVDAGHGFPVGAFTDEVGALVANLEAGDAAAR